VEKVARGVDGRIGLAMISGELSRDGTADISGEKSLIYQWAAPGSSINAVVRGKTVIVQKLAPLGNPTAVAGPTCSTRAAWKAAVAGGMPATGPVTALYSIDFSIGQPGWALTTLKFRYFVENKSCTLKSSNKF
jgi:hypothetical protein